MKIVYRNIWVIPTVIFAILLVIGTQLHPLWADEAETAFFARTVNEKGLPYAFDGVNVTSQAGGAALDKRLLNHINPWLQFYLVAGSFRLFGQSSFTARLPFLPFAVFSIPLIYYLALKLTGNKRTALMACSIACTSVPFILFSTQARYYSLTVFFGLSFILAALHLPDKKLWPKILLVGSLAVMLHSNYFSSAILYAAVFPAFLWNTFSVTKKKDTTIKMGILYVFLGIAGFLLFLPWFLYADPLGSPEGLLISSFADFIQGLPLWFYIATRYFNNDNTFPTVFVLLICALFFTKKRLEESFHGVAFLSFVILVYLGIITFLSAYMVTSHTFFTEIRYNLVLIPLFFILNAILFSFLWSFNKAVCTIVLFLYLSTNIFTLNSLRSFPLEYLGEMLHPYKTSNEVVAEYLKKYAKDKDTAFVNSDRAHESLIFLLGKKI